MACGLGEFAKHRIVSADQGFFLLAPPPFQFALKGNVVDLAVAVVVGGAFGAIVNALVKDLITPLVAALVGKPDFSALTFQINNSKFLYGDFINAVVSFLLIAAAIYFFIVLPMNSLSPE